LESEKVMGDLLVTGGLLIAWLGLISFAGRRNR
jgi:hypothetical protein